MSIIWQVYVKICCVYVKTSLHKRSVQSERTAGRFVYHAGRMELTLRVKDREEGQGPGSRAADPGSDAAASDAYSRSGLETR